MSDHYTLWHVLYAASCGAALALDLRSRNWVWAAIVLLCMASVLIR